MDHFCLEHKKEFIFHCIECNKNFCGKCMEEKKDCRKKSHMHKLYKEYLELESLKEKKWVHIQELAKKLEEEKFGLKEKIKNDAKTIEKISINQNLIEEKFFNYVKKGYLLIKNDFFAFNMKLQENIKNLYNMIKYSNSSIKLCGKERMNSKIIEVEQRINNLFHFVEKIKHLDMCKSQLTSDVEENKKSFEESLKFNSKNSKILEISEAAKNVKGYLECLSSSIEKQVNLKYMKSNLDHCQEYSIKIMIPPFRILD